jgi:trehalose-phosphatase
MADGAGTTPAVWCFDFDGTLSEIVPDRDAARIHPECRDMLAALAGRPSRQVGIISSRALSDLAGRVSVPGVYLGGGSGLEWRLPTGETAFPDDEERSRLAAARSKLLPEIRNAAARPGLFVEDKTWSVAVHTRGASEAHRRALSERLEALGAGSGLRIFPGPAVFEIPFLPETDKSLGIRRLCRLLGRDPDGEPVFYAGDDANDVVAMRWALDHGGIAVAVGDRVRTPGALSASGPAVLARLVRTLAGLADEAEKVKE